MDRTEEHTKGPVKAAIYQHITQRTPGRVWWIVTCRGKTSQWATLAEARAAARTALALASITKREAV
jgi:hypothetical protein